jgi:hypothetical protein
MAVSGCERLWKRERQDSRAWPPVAVNGCEWRFCVCVCVSFTFSFLLLFLDFAPTAHRAWQFYQAPISIGG